MMFKTEVPKQVQQLHYYQGLSLQTLTGILKFFFNTVNLGDCMCFNSSRFWLAEHSGL